jgi:isopentenyl-diphosphate delta-isomerase
MVPDGPENAPPAIQKRKADHLALCASGEVDFRRKGTLLDDLQLVHDALPDRHFDDVDLTTPLLGKKLRAPVVISGMTGGTPEAAQVNKDLARAAETLGLGFGVGSQRAMVIAPDLTWTYQVRDVAPNALVMGNLGIVQARQMSTNAIKELCNEVGVDALCVHLSTSMELIQPGGDRDFRGGQETLKRLVGELGLPIVLKETGAGLSRRVGLTARSIGIHTVDTSAAGGTSWVGVETKRATGLAQKLGDELWDWGIPTAASVGLLSDLGLDIIATGGLRSGTDVAHALALGATAGGLAAPSLRAHKDGGYEGVIAFLESVINAVRAITFLTGCQRPSELRSAPKVIGPSLKAWLEQAK